MGSITADLMDDLEKRYQSCETQFRQFGGRADFQGRIRTVSCLGDTVLVKQVLALPGEGQVLVVDGFGSLSCALLGDLTAAMAARQGWSGVVVHGAVRDSDALAQVPLGIKALGTNPRKPKQEGAGEIDCQVTFGGAVFHPGDMLWSDADGIVITSRP
jgi:regulator of ribonuclease activity A